MSRRWTLGGNTLMGTKITPNMLADLIARGIVDPGPAPRKRRKGPTGHTTLVNAVVAFLTARGILAWQNDSGAVYDPARKCFRKAGKKRRGISDVLAVLPGGRLMALEVKVGRDRLSADQKAFRSDVLKAGGVFVEVRSLDDVAKALED